MNHPVCECLRIKWVVENVSIEGAENMETGHWACPECGCRFVPESFYLQAVERLKGKEPQRVIH